MRTENLERAQAAARVQLLSVTTAQLDDATPCKSWTVRDVINHLITENVWFAQTMRAGESAPFGDTDHTSADFTSAYDDACRDAVLAFGDAGAVDQTVSLPFGQFPAPVYLELATCENLVHGWDLARATGRPSDLDSALAEEVLAGPVVRGLSDEMRGPDGVASFGPRREAPAGAPAADRLAAFFGRVA